MHTICTALNVSWCCCFMNQVIIFIMSTAVSTKLFKKWLLAGASLRCCSAAVSVVVKQHNGILLMENLSET